MPCETMTHDRLLDYRLGRLASDERATVEHHLKTCGDCMRAFLATSKISDVLGVALGTQARVRPDVDACVLESARQGARLQRRRRWLFRFRAAAFAASLAAAIGVVLWLQPQPAGDAPANLMAPEKAVPLVVTSNDRLTLPEPPLHYAKGDLNHDGKVDIADAMLLRQRLDRGEVVPPEEADLNGDGVVDIADVYLLVQRALAVD